jgi:hypothetical protein
MRKPIAAAFHQSYWFLKLSAARMCRGFKPLFTQHVHAARSRDFFSRSSNYVRQLAAEA